MNQAHRTRFRPAVERIESRELLSAVSPLVLPTRAVEVASIRELGRGFDRTRFVSERRKLTARDYPNLGGEFEVLAPSSDRYNCIAHSLGLHDRWLAPRTGTGTARNPLAWADRLYAKGGYARLPTPDTSLQPGQQKVVVYGYVNRNGTIREVRHAAIQDADGTWTSKLGHFALIRHPTPALVSGPLYGRPIAVYARAV
ncbi:MAG TPA: hypothetical protein VF590_24000 [Isosphaeraceae bacterium]|jgi:hypothetical protein